MKSPFSLSFVIKAAISGIAVAGALFYAYTYGKAASPAPQLTAPIEHSPVIKTEPPTQSAGPFSYADAVKKAMPAVVNIYTARKVITQNNVFSDPLLQEFFGNPRQAQESIQTGSGSGVILSREGHLLTNYHVIQSAEQLRVLLSDGRDYAAAIIGADPETDIAVLKIDAQDLVPISVSTADDLAVGDVVLAIGNPFGVGQTVTMGIISATGRDRLGLNTFENFIQTDAAINPGNSGGALVNAHGELVGINTAIFSNSGGSLGIGFAIPANMAGSVLKQILSHGKVIRGWLGIDGRDLPHKIRSAYQVDGVFIAGVFQNGPAALAGIRPGDIITEINTTPIRSAREVLDLVSRLAPGTQLNIRVLRSSHYFMVTATVIQRPSAQLRR